MHETCAEVAALVEGVRDDQRAAPTPCAEYTVADLLDHLDGVAVGFTVAADRVGVADRLRGLADAWGVPAAWEGETEGPVGLVLPNAVWGRIVLTEVVVHGWDLATATGNGLALPEDALRHCYEHVVRFVPEAPLPELWGPPVAVPPDAPLLDRILGITGRTPV
ncbi:maleylpyruvate isomerase family mycothiol-dependent enzyme [Actinokineospora sp. PR83]|uniref:maleylpyruvate isomerase family mycothiol-dependent enzyme n=1 Tax=Actinokineospora sp. PR83 TaxID=2884908 RepID=UPI001F36F4D4|nr:maleylpyruvate isomerase family mycothiol-dependent enzyme [Actinokineospora sp. PR83]MCG8915798.1 maleylpyruvate isomerase family mycothiol-dependent enzyme [Actinokineospora sp. PR83]